MYTDKITLPYWVVEVLKEQQRLLQVTPRKRYVGRQLLACDINSLASYLRWKLHCMDMPLSFFLSSLDPFLHRTITEAELQFFLKRLICVIALEESPLQPVTPWIVQEKDEWIPFEVLKVTQTGQALYSFRCKAIGGRMVDHVFDYRVSMKMAFRMARRAGFNQRSELKRMVDPLQFVGLRLVLLIAKESSPGRIKVLDCGEHATTVSYNQKINKLRDPEFRKCPFQQRTVCFRCGIGKDQCELAVIEETCQNNQTKLSKPSKPS